MTLIPGILIGVLFRLLMLVNEKSLWGDEWFSIGLAAQSIDKVFWGGITDVHPPTYFLMLHGVIQLFGYHEIAFRLLSFLSGFGVLFFSYQVSRKMFGADSAKLTLWLVAISPYWLQSSNEIRSYSLFAFASVFLVYALIGLLEQGENRSVWPATLALAAIGVIWVEHYGWFVLAAGSFYLFLHPDGGRALGQLKRYFPLIFLGASFSVLLVAYQAMFRENMFHSYRVLEYLDWKLIGKKIVGIFWHFSNGYTFSMLTPERIATSIKQSPLFLVFAVNAAAASTLVLSTWFDLLKTDKKNFIFFGLLLVLPVLLLTFAYPVRAHARYLVFAAPIFFILLAEGIRRSTKVLRVGILAITIFVSIYGSVHAILLKTDVVHKEDYPTLIRSAFERASGRDAICGLGPQVVYYQKKLGLSTDAQYFDSLEKLLNQFSTRRFEKIFVIDVVNMDDKLTQKYFENYENYLIPYGYQRWGRPQKFGSADGMVALFEYRSIERKGNI